MKKSIMLLVPVILVLSACGGDDQSTREQTEPYAMQYLPKQSSIVIPWSLLGQPVNSSEKILRAIESSGETGFATAKVINRVTEAEVSRLSNQVPLLMLDAVWPEIESHCKNVAPGTDCTIPQGTITLQLTDEIIAAAQIVAEKIEAVNNNQQGGISFEATDTAQLSIVSGDQVGLGTIVYTAFSAESEFQHEVSLDLSEMEKINGLDSGAATTLLLKWPASERSVVSSYAFENSDSTYVYTYSYLADGNEESLEIKYSGSENGLANLPNTYVEVVTLKVLDDSNNATLVGFEWRHRGEQGIQSFSAVGRADNDYGTLQADFFSDYNSEGKAELISYSKKETFDGSGVVIKSSVCEVNCDNSAAWVTGGSSSSSNTTTINGDKNETTTTITETVTESPLIDIFVTGLEDGSYTIALDGFDGSREDKLGYGFVMEGVADFSYWGEETEIGSVKIYTSRTVNDEAGYRYAYIAVDGAQITLADTP